MSEESWWTVPLGGLAMLHELNSFPMRPVRQIGESLAGFICRFLNANGHRMPKALCDAIATVYRSSNSQNRHDAWLLLCEVMGETPEDYLRLWIEDRFTLPLDQAQRLNRHWQSPTAHRFRLCPECLQTHGVHLAFWDLPLVFVCPVHKCMLTTECTCGMHIAWAMVRRNWTCFCGQYLGDLSARQAPRSLVSLSMAIAIATDLRVPGVIRYETEKFRLAKDLRSTYDLLAWLLQLLRILRSTSESIRSLVDVHEQWRFGPVLEQWPTRLKKILRYCMRRNHRRDRESLLIAFPEKNQTKKLLNFLSAATANSALPTSLREAILHALLEAQPAHKTFSQLAFNPAFDVTQRKGTALALQNWWREFSEWGEIGAWPVPQSSLSRNKVSEIDERSCLLLLNRLVKVAERSTAAPNMRRLASSLPSLPVHIDSLTSGAFLELVYRQFLSISRAHREYLHELVLDVTGGTHVAN